MNLGQIFLLLGTCFAGTCSIFAINGAYKQSAKLVHKLSNLSTLAILLAFCFLLNRYLSSDFSYINIFKHSNSLMPTIYKLTASWGNHEGSMLLFISFLSLYNFVFTNFSKYENKYLASAIQCFLIFLFGVYIFFVSDPFLQFVSNIPTQGAGLNPLLQDLGLAIHPPLLYLGYSGFSISYCLALTAVIANEPDEAWVLESKKWSLISFAFLTIGVALGSWWAYRELGWGGFWFWDPVENTSLLPWLVGLALIHSLLSSKKFGLVKNLTIFLSILSFVISSFGFFIVRSGILSSVHSFATDPIRGIFMLLIVVVIALFGFYLLAFKGLKSKQPPILLAITSRHGLILINIMILLVLALTLIIAILYPIILELFFEARISVGEPYFNAVYIPVSFILMFFMVYTPYLKWPKEGFLKPFKKSARSLFLSFLIAFALYYFYPENISLKLVLAIFLSLWVIISLSELLIIRSFKREKISRGFLAMCIAHIGFGLLGFAISINAAFEDSLQQTLDINQQVQIAGFTVSPQNYELTQSNNYFAQIVEFNVKSESKQFSLKPENRVYMPKFTKTFESDIYSSLFYDFYLVMGESKKILPNLEEQVEGAIENKNSGYSFQTKIYYKPVMSLIWLSALIMAMGALLAAIPKKQNK